MKHTEAVVHEFGVTAKYVLFLIVLTISSVYIQTAQHYFWVMFIAVFIQSMVHDSEQITHHTSLAIQCTRTLTNFLKAISLYLIVYFINSKFQYEVRTIKYEDFYMRTVIHKNFTSPIVGGISLYLSLIFIFCLGRFILNFLRLVFQIYETIVLHWEDDDDWGLN